MSKLFFSYRQSQDRYAVTAIYDRLATSFGRDNIFKDVDSIPIGSNFGDEIKRILEQCDVLLSIIGPNWLDVTDQNGNRKLDDKTDFVRLEISTALRRHIPIVPVLLDNTNIPSSKQLPNEISRLSSFQAIPIRANTTDFNQDIERLIAAVTPYVEIESTLKSRHPYMKKRCQVFYNNKKGWLGLSSGPLYAAVWFDDLEEKHDIEWFWSEQNADVLYNKIKCEYGYGS